MVVVIVFPCFFCVYEFSEIAEILPIRELRQARKPDIGFCEWAQVGYGTGRTFYRLFNPCERVGRKEKGEPRCSRRVPHGFGRSVVEDGDSGHIYREARQP